MRDGVFPGDILRKAHFSLARGAFLGPFHCPPGSHRVAHGSLLDLKAACIAPRKTVSDTVDNRCQAKTLVSWEYIIQIF